MHSTAGAEERGKMTAYLVVSKITKDEICVVGKIPPQPQQNELAREMAEIAITMACIN